ncbi:hypothetical protein FE391_33885 [Nonomuraea sp. KC401]|uniref:hypothetical protein n=1 Tax=unclassified Nonomuraea TaxID=2593643 RepID=UPI0010FEA9E2|nr:MULTISPECIES: hypothetical protein [unclassified Nonomuraea]NBE98652.1 hypothetical protein [Nonomuraea sp. K271]TLF60096.1 hypothetical protein FE391_33885 [Nonomuraea sp. KC401]
MDLDEVAGRLYALPPSEFTAARTAEARAAKDAGDVRLSREIAKLRKPTVSAWAVNRVAREHPGELGELLEVGERLRAAWQEQDAEALAELTRRRGEVTRTVGRLARQAGDLSAAASAEVDQTLDAAMVDADAAGQVRRATLAKPLSYSGFAPAPVRRERPAARRRPAPDEEAARAKEREEAEARKAKERQEAENAHREWREALEAATKEHDERADKVASLERKLDEARKRLADSRQRLEVAQREERHARRRLER